MKPVFIIMLFPLISYSQGIKSYSLMPSLTAINNEALFYFEGSRFKGKVKLDTTYYAGGSIKAIGCLALCTNGGVSSRKVGRWTEFYPDRSIKSHGAYELSSMYTCQNAMSSMVYYTYKSGDWVYFYQSGQLKAKGRYGIEEIPEGNIQGQNRKKAVIDATWTLQDENNTPLKAEGTIKAELEKEW